jgi:hypothetical protein
LTTQTCGSFGNGGFYLIDGAAVNPNAAPDVALGTTAWTYSWISSLTPQQAPAGSGDVTLTINGSNFTSDSSACWNCISNMQYQFLPTSYVSSRQLTATIPASLLATPGMFPISVFDSSSNLFSTDAPAFTVTSVSASGTTQVTAIDLAGFAMDWDPLSARLYVGTADFDSAYPNSIVALDGESGSIVKVQPVESDPWVVSVSANGQYVYAGYFSTTDLTQLELPGLGSPMTWSLTDPGSSEVYYAGALKAAPVSPHTTAVSLWNMNLYPTGGPWDTGGLVIYDDNVERPDFLAGWGSTIGLPGPESYMTLAWGASDQVLASAGAGGPILDLQVSSSGVAFIANGSDNSFNACGGEIHSDFGTGLIYSDCGIVADPTTGATVGTYNASGLLAPDSSLNRVFVLGQTAAQSSSGSYTIESFDEKAFTPIGSITLDYLWGSPIQLIRCGTSGLAILTISEAGNGTQGMIYLVKDSTFVSDRQKDVSRSSRPQESVQQRWKRISKADIVRMMRTRTAAESR